VELKLFTPGPTPLPLDVREALSKPIIHHRSEDFQTLLKSIRPSLRKAFGTSQEVMLLSSSGTGGMEAAVVSILRKSDRVLVIDAGKFGERFSKLTQTFGIKTDVLRIDWGKSLDLNDLKQHLTSEHTALLLQHSETSTGALHPLEEICKWVKREFPACLILVDGITSIGAMPFLMDEWGVDAAITGSQKAFMCPPGLAMVSLSARALERLDNRDLPGFYFDLKREWIAIQKNTTAFTPAINIIQGLAAALQLMEKEGFAQVYTRHRRLSEGVRAACPHLSLKLAAETPGVACTSAFFPTSIDGKAFLKKVKNETGYHFAGAQEQWEGKVIRIAHLGAYSADDLRAALIVLANALSTAGIAVNSLKALEAFDRAYGAP